jgi:predicted signal transduction protein with EAL and GGDEF domain
VLVLAGLSCGAEALAMLGRLEAALRLPYWLPGGHKVQVGLSMGLSVFPADAEDAQELLQHADTALYRAKSDKSPAAPRCLPWTPGHSPKPAREVSSPESAIDEAAWSGKDA